MHETSKVYVHQVNSDEDIKKVVRQVVSELELDLNKKILIKPNFVCPRSSKTGATTDLGLIEEVVKVLINKGVQITLGEGAGFEFDTDKVFDILGVKSLAQKYNFSLVNLRKAKTECVDIGGKVLKKISLPKPVLEADAILNMPKFKTHMLTGMTFAMKNFIGLLPDEERRKAHIQGIDQSVVDLVNYFEDKNTLTIGDAITTMGGLGGPGYGTAIKSNVLIWGQDNVAIDEVAFNLFRIDTAKIKYLKIAQKNPRFSSIDIIGNIEKLERFPVPDSGFFYKLSYRLMHTFDYLTSVFHRESLIPRIATKIGTRPEISEACTKCGKCRDACPVGAISPEYQIDFEKCRFVRCLNCRDVCPQNAIKIKGFLLSKSEDRQ